MQREIEAKRSHDGPCCESSMGRFILFWYAGNARRSLFEMIDRGGAVANQPWRAGLSIRMQCKSEHLDGPASDPDHSICCRKQSEINTRGRDLRSRRSLRSGVQRIAHAQKCPFAENFQNHSNACHVSARPSIFEIYYHASHLQESTLSPPKFIHSRARFKQYGRLTTSR